MKARKLSILFVVLATVYLTVGMVLANETTVFEPLSHESTLAAPTLTGTTAGTTVSLSWTSVVGATGYILYYAPYPYTGSDSIGNISMGTQTSMSASLWDGAAFYVAVKAYDSKHFSGYSNIELFSVLDKIPDTGQIQCYNNSGGITCPQSGEDFYGQDASYTIYPLSYTKLDASGKALPDSASSWAMVRDNVTGLIWEVKTSDRSIHDMENTYTWWDAQDVFLASLNESGFGGYTDWRIPSVKELAYIVNMGINRPAIDTAYFPNTMSTDFWSSTTYALYSDHAWGIDFSYGSDYYDYKTNSHCVRAVRGVQVGSCAHLVINGDGTVTDTSTGLMWQQNTASNRMTWESALSYCEGLSFASYTDWRLPNIKELRSIVDYETFGPAIDTSYFPETGSSGYWSSTTYVYYNEGAWGISFGDGGGYGYDKSYRYYVRAVRSGQ